MSHHDRFFLPAVSVLVVLLSITPASAQDAPGSWSRIIRPQACHPEHPCPPREGMLWDSANAAPRYPVVMQQVGIGGEAVLSFRVSPDGVVEAGSVAVLSASNDAFVRGSVEAVSSGRFRTQIEQRPQEPVPVQVKLIFAHLGSCQGGPAQQHIGWAADNQLVTAACVERIPRDQVQGLK